MPDDGDAGPEDRLQHEAEELMRQRRFRDAARRYQDLHGKSPTDLWTSLGFVSALECAGEMDSAERVLEDAATRHGMSASLHRFRHLFFVRREDLRRASASQKALRQSVIDAGESDQLADLYFNQGRYHEALAELERRLADRELDPSERVGLMARSGACMRQTGDAENARDRLLMALALDPEAAWTLAELAEAERALGLADQARLHYRQSLERQPQDYWTRGHLAQLEAEQGETDRAVALYEEILGAEPHAVWAKVELAQVLTEKNPERSGELCRSAIADDAEYPWAHAQLGVLARKAGKLDEAHACYLCAHKAAPEAAWVLHEACEVARAMGREDMAERHLERARSNDPYDATTHGYIADLRRHQNRLRDAQAHLEQAVQLDADYTWAWRELAEVRALTGDHDGADDAYRHARDLAPDDSVSDGLMAFLLKHRGLRERGRPWLERAVERQADYLWAWRELAELHLEASRAHEAERAARDGLAKIPDAAPLFGLLAEALRRQGRHIDAATAVSQAIERAPQVPQLWALRAELCNAQDDPTGAAAAAAKAAELDRAPEFAVLHAQTLLSAGREREALVELDRALAVEHPPQVAHELAAALAERRGDRAVAITHLDRALKIEEDIRLRVRRVRLAVAGGDSTAAASLLPLLDRESGVPWSELAMTFAQAGMHAPARRAAYRHVAQAPAAAGWLHLAEIELHLGDLRAAHTAIAAATAVTPADPAVRAIAAVIAEHLNDLPGAVVHLEAALAARPGDHALQRQVALLRERLGRRDDAEAMWRSLADGAAPSDGRTIELAAALYRLARDDEAARLAAPVLAAPVTPELMRLWRDRGIAAARTGTPAAGLAALSEREDLLGMPGRSLAVQLGLAAGEVRAARRHLDGATPEGDLEQRIFRILSARVLLAEGKPDQALISAREAAAMAPGEEDPLIVAADALLALGKPVEALAQLDGEPRVWPPERAAVASLIALTIAGPTAAAARLMRTPDPGAHPLGRLMAAALPGVAPEAAARAGKDTIAALPPPLVTPLGDALGRAGRHDLAIALHLLAAQAARGRGEPFAERFHRRAAIDHIRSGSGRAAALRQAWSDRDIPGLLQQFLPW
ncbi:MAG: tetratricopeptide repeat protein [Planctomycetota bacterium]